MVAAAFDMGASSNRAAGNMQCVILDPGLDPARRLPGSDPGQPVALLVPKLA